MLLTVKVIIYLNIHITCTHTHTTPSKEVSRNRSEYLDVCTVCNNQPENNYFHAEVTRKRVNIGRNKRMEMLTRLRRPTKVFDTFKEDLSLPEKF